MSTSSAHIYLNTLRHVGYVVKQDRTYHLGFKFLRHGGHVRKGSSLYQSAKPEVDDIIAETGEISAIGIEEKGKRVLIYQNEGDHALGDNVHVGEYIPMHWTAIGKALLAHLPDKRIDEIIDEHGLQPATSRTITESAPLRKELNEIRKRGYAIDEGEKREGLRGIAVPLLDEQNTIAGAIGVAGPKNRFDENYVSSLLQLLQTKRNVIELQISYY